MWRILTTLMFCSMTVAQEGRPILTDEGKPIKVIIGTKVVTPETMPMLMNKPSTTADQPTGLAVVEQLPPPRVLAIDPVATPKRIGVVQYLLGETLAYLEERRSQIRPASHKTLSGQEPGLLHESILDSKSPETPAPLPPQEVRVTHSALPAAQPPFTTAVVQQMIAILAAVIVLAVLTLAAYFLVLRKYVPFHSLFQVQVVGGIPSGIPYLPSALAQAEHEVANDPFADVTPNFELGPTYEEEMAMKQAAVERQELAVLSHIADLNANMQHELMEQGLLSDTPAERTALETLTQPEPAV